MSMALLKAWVSEVLNVGVAIGAVKQGVAAATRARRRFFVPHDLDKHAAGFHVCSRESLEIVGLDSATGMPARAMA